MMRLGMCKVEQGWDLPEILLYKYYSFEEIQGFIVKQAQQYGEKCSRRLGQVACEFSVLFLGQHNLQKEKNNIVLSIIIFITPICGEVF